MWGDASHRALSAALHVHATTQHWTANRFSPPTATQAKRGLLCSLGLSVSIFTSFLPPFFKASQQQWKNILIVQDYIWYILSPGAFTRCLHISDSVQSCWTIICFIFLWPIDWNKRQEDLLISTPTFLKSYQNVSNELKYSVGESQ